MWPFSRKSKTPVITEQEWVTKTNELARQVAKVKEKIGPQVARTVLTGQNATADTQLLVEFEVVLFCLHVCERVTRQRFGASVPTTLSTLLVDRTATILTAGIRDDLAVERIRVELRTLYAARNENYKTYARLRASKGESEHGTLVDGFGKLMTATYAGKNALARAMLSAQAIELVKTMPDFLDKVGLRAA
jgi:hypothetical protein